MKYLLTTSILLAFGAFAQQESLTSFYWNNYSYFNPAMSGVEHEHEANATYRTQWNQVNGAPNTLFVNYGMNLADKHGIGINYVYETIGFTSKNEVKVNYNYQLKLDEDRKLALGTAVGFNRLSVSPFWIPPTGLIDPILPSAFTQNAVHLDLGAAYYGNSIIAGLGVTRLPLYQVDNTTSFTFAPHMFGNFRYQAPFLGSSKLIFETQLRTDFVKYSQDFNVGFNWNDLVEARVGYRTSDAVMFNLTGIIAQNYRIGYSYDLTINQLSSISRGSHEITLGFRLPTN
ncbi:MAG: PorP/SprF family type IX secretion system membrane protein [Crocinitomicaceae bacterium]